MILKKNSEFLSLKEKGTKIRASNWMLISYMKGQNAHLKVGITVGKKVGPAVIRNKLKRWCREYFRSLLKSGDLPGVIINVIFRPIDEKFYRRITYQEVKPLFDSSVEEIRKRLKL